MVPDPDGVLGWKKVFSWNFPGSPGETELDHIAARRGRIDTQNAQLLVFLPVIQKIRFTRVC